MDTIDDFNFYLGFTKQLVLNLPNPKDRTIAASWLKKLREIHEKDAKDNVHIDYLKLLLIVMHGNNFSTFFEKPPAEENLKPININEIISAIKPSTKSTNYPFVYTSVGGDLCDYVAIQEIPNYGLHGYYAISNEPLSNWIHTRSASYNKDLKYTDFGKRIHPTPPISEPTQTSETENVKESGNQNKTSSRESLKDDLNVQRRETISFETRPCWGSNRYIERLINESPNFISDLELSQADAFLHNFKDRKMKKVKKGSIKGPCLLSSKRRQVERMMDLPRCAMDPGEENIEPKISKSKRTYFTCRPKEEMEININCVDPCLNEDTEDDEEDAEDAFLNEQENEYKSRPERNIKSRIKIQNRIPSYNNYFKNTRTTKPVIEKNYPSDQNEIRYVEDNPTEFSSKRKNRFHKSMAIDPKVQEKSLGKDFSDKRRTNITLPSHLSNLRSRVETMRSYGPVSDLAAESDLYSRHETKGSRHPLPGFPVQNDSNSRRQSMGSYGPVSSFSNEIGISNTQGENYEAQNRNFVSLPNDTSRQGRKSRTQGLTSQDFVSLRTDVGENEIDNNSWENLFSNSNQLNANLENREDVLRKNLTTSGLTPRRVKFPNGREIRSYCPDD